MKKLLMLPALGAAAALTYGAAATLNVNPTAAIQVGTTDNVWCATSAEIAGWGYEGDDGLVYNVRVILADGGGACDGATLFVTVLDGTGNGIASGKLENLSAQPAGGYSVAFTTPVDAADIEGARLAIEG